MNYRELLIRLISMTTPFVYDDTLTFLEMTRKFNKIINEVLEVVQGLLGDMDDLSANVKTYDARITTNTNNIAQDEIEIQKNATNISDLRDYVDEYFDSLNVSIVVRQVLNEMVADGTLERLLNESVLADINADILDLKSRVGTLETTSGSHTTQINQIDTRVQTLESDNITNKTNINSLQTTTGQLSTRVGTLETATTNNTQKIASNTSNVATLQSNVATLQSNVAVNTSKIATNTSSINAISDFIQFGTYTQYGANNIIIADQSRNATITSSNLGIAISKDRKMFKLYGRIYFNTKTAGSSQTGSRFFEIQTPIRPSEEINVDGCGLVVYEDSHIIGDVNMRLYPSGRIRLIIQSDKGVSQCARLFGQMIFVENFGDKGDE